MKKTKIFKHLLIIVASIVAINFNNIEVKAASNDTNLIGRIFSDIYAIQQYKTGGTRIYEAQVYNMIKNGKIDMGYCIQIGQKISTLTYDSTSDYNKVGLTKEDADYVRLVAYYGYNYSNHSDYKYFLAAQELIWEHIGEDEIYWTIGATPTGTRVNVDNEKEEIENLVKRHYVKPQFEDVSISYNQPVTLVDKNNILSEYKITNVKNATYAVSGNNITITPTSLGDVTINLKRNLKKTYTNQEMFYYATDSQNIVSTGIVDENNFQITLKNNGVKVKINKKDASTNENINISGISFKIYDVDNQKYVCDNTCEFSTNDLGIAITPTLKAGNYKLEEIDQPINGYLYNPETIEFTISPSNITTTEEYGNVIEIDFYNQSPTGSLTINKKGEEMIFDNNLFSYKEINLENIEFSIITNQDIYYNDKLHKSGEVIAIIKTDSEGIATIEGLLLGSYTIKEISTNPLYEKNDTNYTINFTYKDQYTKVIKETLEVKNILKKGSIQFRKVDSNTKEGLKDVIIAIYDEFDNLIYEGKTNSNGNIYLDNLAYGKYYIKEIQQLDGYIINENQINFEINEDNSIAKVTMENEKIELPPKTSNKRKSSFSTIIIFSSIIYLLCHKQKVMI